MTKQVDKIDQSGWVQLRCDWEKSNKATEKINKATEKKRGRGRPRKDNAYQFKTVGLTPEQWAWVEKWFPGASPSDQLRAVLDRSIRFWPGGPSVFGHKKKGDQDKDGLSDTVL